MSSPTKVCCPSCGTQVPWTESSRWRPFCSPRCKAVDLGEWASDRFVIAGDPLDDAPGSADQPAR